MTSPRRDLAVFLSEAYHRPRTLLGERTIPAPSSGPPSTERTPFVLGERAQLVGRCVGRRRLGRRLLFLDLVPAELPSNSERPPPTRHPTPDTRAVQPPQAARRIRDLVADPHLFTVVLTEGDGFMPPEDFAALCISLGDPAVITKPRIGDLFAVRGLWEKECILQGRRVKRLRADACTLLARGAPSRPGDFSDKAWHIAKDRHHARSRQAQEKKAARRHRHGLQRKSQRAVLFSRWAIETFGPGIRCVDVAGGAGGLSRALIAQGCQSTLIDPRGAVAGIPSIPHRFDLADATVQQACTEVDVLLGMHPDGAVNAIVEAACTLRRSFAIVPCCVFPRAYPRRLADGTEVIERDALCRWILEACRARGWQGPLGHFELPMEGARHGVYGRWTVSAP